jgi:AcrR family transcriptional regulator
MRGAAAADDAALTGDPLAPDAVEPSRVGRPRDPRVDAAVHRATLELLVEHGYQATTIQAIARRAGVSAPSIYRRWSSKAELIEDAVFPSGLLAPETLTGDVDVDLQPYCLRILEHLSDPAVRVAIPGLLIEYQTDPLLWQRVVERSVIPMRELFEGYLQTTGRRAVGNVEALFDVLLGALFTRALNVGSFEAEQFSHELARVVNAAAPPDTRLTKRRS